MAGRYELLPTTERSTSPVPPYSPYNESSSSSPTSPKASAHNFAHFLHDAEPFLSRTSSSHSSTTAVNEFPSDYDPLDPERPPYFSSNPRTRDTRECIRAFHADPRFNPPPPSPLARLALVLFCAGMFWIALSTRKAIWVDGGMGMGEPVEVVDGRNY
ncbi:hypothetical protein DFP72DRAFT_1065254 [Ephemerocybe angulata]|uniref:Uncharacterized protein n=1 Tax=Ephemerocybe angulata TaxID=980116 RepID=A0A8H6I387_9AGAR|nr:hypothetical protein DFP72DRAFT_1065254 [Tulosesus angulatus]